MRKQTENAVAVGIIEGATSKAMPRDLPPQVLADIDRKVFDDTTLDITTAQANDWTVAMTVVFPVIAAITGLVIWVRRKHA